MPTTTKRADRHAAFAAEALMIRRLHAYRGYRDVAKERGADVTADPDTPTFAAMSDRYVRLLDEWITETPNTFTAM